MIFEPQLRLASHSRYADQLARGFGWLQFLPTLESEYREAYQPLFLQRARLALLVGVGAIIVFMVTDLVIMPADFAIITTQIRGGIMLPAVLLGYYATYHAKLQPHLDKVLIATCLIAGWSGAAIGAIGASHGISSYFPAAIVVTIYFYFFFGLPTASATIAGVTLLISYLMLIIIFRPPLEVAVYNSLSLTLANIIGIAGAYMLERYIRTSFLETQILNELAALDGLTGLHNRREFDSYLGRLWMQMKREKKGLLVLIADVDCFKGFNDHYGHQAGDACLKELAAVIGDAARRPQDFSGRYGGEEFVVLLAAPEHRYAIMLVEQLRAGVEALRIPHAVSTAAEVVTVSIGATYVYPAEDDISPEQAVKLADQALYEAKEHGRNQSVFQQPYRPAMPGDRAPSSGPAVIHDLNRARIKSIASK